MSVPKESLRIINQRQAPEEKLKTLTLHCKWGCGFAVDKEYSDFAYSHSIVVPNLIKIKTVYYIYFKFWISFYK